MHLVAAIKAFFRVLSQGDAAVAAPQAPPPPADAFRASGQPAVQLLGLLQKEGRLVDFLREDIAPHSDADIGAAVRPIHEGCRRVLAERFRIEPIRAESEGATVTLDGGYDAGANSLSGKVGGVPPFKGRVVHRGWRAAEVKLPTVPPGADATIVAPAQIDVS